MAIADITHTHTHTHTHTDRQTDIQFPALNIPITVPTHTAIHLLNVSMPKAAYSSAIQLPRYQQACSCLQHPFTCFTSSGAFAILVEQPKRDVKKRTRYAYLRFDPSPPNHSRQPWIYTTKLFLKPHYTKFLMCGDLKLWPRSCKKTFVNFKISYTSILFRFCCRQSWLTEGHGVI
jgi:hypothetical protein